MNQNEAMIREIDALYDWLDQTLADHEPEAGHCCACGLCCDFDAYGHRLYVTHAEMLHFSAKNGPEHLKAMSSGQCPYLVDHRCSVHKHRFVGCRTYGCQGNSDFQNQLTEEALDKIKALCNQLEVPYEYMDLRHALSPTKCP